MEIIRTTSVVQTIIRENDHHSSVVCFEYDTSNNIVLLEVLQF